MPPTDIISTLSDRELASRLREYGVNVGPIVKSTRSLYEKKLRKLDLGEVTKPKYEEVPDDDEEESEEESEEKEEEIPAQVSRPNEPRRRVPTKVTPSRATRPAESKIREEMTSRTQRQTGSAPPSRKEQSKSKGFPIWTVVLILIILGAIGYLIVKNMEPNAESSIPNQIDTEV